MLNCFTLAHLSDPHLGPLPGLRPAHWNVKRALGFANWHRNRKAVHRPEVLAALVADLRSQAPDHIAVTGDLINIGLPAEYEAASRWLAVLGPPERVSVVPGNHDIYVRLRRDPGVARWGQYMAGFGPDGSGFPYLRRLGNIALIGLNSAVPTPPLVAAGRLGPGQIASLAVHLEALGREGVARIVLIHHPPLAMQASRLKALGDAAELEATIARHGAELVLHGHNHRSELNWVGHSGRRVPVVGVPSASLGKTHKGEMLARYHLFRIGGTGGPPRIEVIARGLATSGGPVVEIERRAIPG